MKERKREGEEREEAERNPAIQREGEWDKITIGTRVAFANGKVGLFLPRNFELDLLHNSNPDVLKAIPIIRRR